MADHPGEKDVKSGAEEAAFSEENTVAEEATVVEEETVDVGEENRTFEEGNTEVVLVDQVEDRIADKPSERAEGLSPTVAKEPSCDEELNSAREPGDKEPVCDIGEGFPTEELDAGEPEENVIDNKEEVDKEPSAKGLGEEVPNKDKEPSKEEPVNADMRNTGTSLEEEVEDDKVRVMAGREDADEVKEVEEVVEAKTKEQKNGVEQDDLFEPLDKEPDVRGELAEDVLGAVEESRNEGSAENQFFVIEDMEEANMEGAEVVADLEESGETTEDRSAVESLEAENSQMEEERSATKRGPDTGEDSLDVDTAEGSPPKKRERTVEPEHNYSRVPAKKAEGESQLCEAGVQTKLYKLLHEKRHAVKMPGSKMVFPKKTTTLKKADMVSLLQPANLKCVPVTSPGQAPAQASIQKASIPVLDPVTKQVHNVPSVMHSAVLKPASEAETISTDHLFTIEVKTVSTVGGVAKAMTVTVLNVAAVSFKCAKCSQPVRSPVSSSQLKYSKSHTCTAEDQKVAQQVKVDLGSPVTRSASKALMLATLQAADDGKVGAKTRAKTALGSTKKALLVPSPAGVKENKATPRHQTRGRPRKYPVVPSEKTKKAEDKSEAKDTEDQAGRGDEKEKDNEEDKLSSKSEQLAFIESQYQARRWNLRKRKKKRITASEESNGDQDDDVDEEEDCDIEEKKAVKNDVRGKRGDCKKGSDNEDDTDGDEDVDSDGPMPGEDKAIEQVKDKTGIKIGGGRPPKGDFCIQCYLKLDHVCKIKLMAENRKACKTCNFCGKTFKTVNSLNQHVRVHTDERPFKCKECGKAFRRTSTLFEHMRIHGGEKRFLCSICGRKFLRKSDHTAHLRIHNNDFRHRCTECGKGFKGNAQLEVHMRKHTGETPFLCTVCGRKFKHPFGLRVHMKYHEMVENPLRCTECERVYEDPDELRMHDCPYGKQHMCSVCGKTFANPFASKGHMKIHLRPNPSVCKSCHVTFPNERDLQQHQDENIVKCSVCDKTIKEARSCMLSALPGNPLKGKKFKCWKCHSNQAGTKSGHDGTEKIPDSMEEQCAVQPSTAPVLPPPDIVSSVAQTLQQMQPEVELAVHTSQHLQQQQPPPQQQQVLQPSMSINHSMPPSSSNTSQPVGAYHMGQQTAALQLDQSMHSSQSMQPVMAAMDPSMQISSASGHMTQASHSEQHNQMYQPPHTEYSSMIQQVQNDPIHYSAQPLQPMQQYAHHPQSHPLQQQQAQPQHQLEMQSVYQLQPVQQQPLLPQHNILRRL